MTKLKITVTKEIIEKSAHCGFCPESYSVNTNCAIALAIRDIFPKAVVEERGIFIVPDKWSERLREGDFDIKLPARASRFINSFDLSFSVEERLRINPISFEIEIPDRIIEQINIEELRPLLTNHPTLELV